MSYPGHYCIVQYCPDLGRLEVANIGVLLYCQQLGFLETKMSTPLGRVRKFFGAEIGDWSQLHSFCRGAAERITRERESIHSLADLERFCALRANQILITPPRPMVVDDPRQDLENLFLRLVTE